MWIGNIKVKEKITETLIFFCQVLMIFFKFFLFFLPFYLTSMTMVNEYKYFFFCFVFLLNIAQSVSGVRPE